MTDRSPADFSQANVAKRFAWQGSPVLQGLAAFVIAAGIVALMQVLHGGLFDPDGYYHIRMAQMYWDGSVPAAGGDFHWTQHSLWNGNFSDKDYLWHIFLIPFVWVFGAEPPGLEFAGVAGAAFAAGFGGLVVVRILRARGVVWPVLWVLLLYGSSETFLFRAGMCRSYLLSIPFALLGWHLLVLGGKAARWPLLVLSIIYTLAYTAPHILLVLAFLCGVTVVLSGDGRLRSRIWQATQPMLWIAAGIVIGLLLHPQPLNMARLWLVQNLVVPLHSYGLAGLSEHFAALAGFAGAGSVNVTDLGMELAAPDGREIATGGVVGLLLLMVPWVLASATRTRPSRADMAAWLAAAMFFWLWLMSERFAEYYFPFGVVAAAMLTTRALASEPMEAWCERHPKQAAVWPVVLVIAVIGVAAFRVHSLHNMLKSGSKPREYEAMAAAIKQHVPAGSGIYHPSWDEMPQLLYYGPEYDYVTGLDPLFMAARSKHVYEVYRSVARGERIEAWKIRPMDQVIREEFGMVYAIARPKAYGAYAVELQRAEKAFEPRVTLLASDKEDTWRLYRLSPPGAK